MAGLSNRCPESCPDRRRSRIEGFPPTGVYNQLHSCRYLFNHRTTLVKTERTVGVWGLGPRRQKREIPSALYADRDPHFEWS